MYEFEVVASTQPPPPPTGFTGAGWYGGGNLTADYFDASGNLTQTYSNNLIHPASGGTWSSGSYPCGPYDDCCEAVVACFEGTPFGMGYYCVTDTEGNQSVLHIPTLQDELQTFEGCNPANVPSPYLSINGPFDTEAQAAHFCQNRHLRYRCNSVGRCEWFLTDDANEGYASCEAANCEVPPPPPPPTTYERFVCALQGGVSSCVRILTTSPTTGFADCEAANCDGPTPPPPVPVYTRYRCNASGQCEAFQTTEPSLGFADCEQASCQPPPPAFVTRYRCTPQGLCESFQTTDPAEGFTTCEAANCVAPPTGDVYWCAQGHVQSGANPPAGVSTYPSQQACINAGCALDPPVYTRYRCTAQGACESFSTDNPNAGFATCEAANCGDTTTPVPVYTRWRCDEFGVCESFFTADPTEGFEDCAHAACATTPEPGPCDYFDHPIANISGATGANLSFSLSRLQNAGWTVLVTYALDNLPQPNPPVQTTEMTWNWSVTRVPGVHHFLAELTKEGCPQTHVVEFSLTITGSGGGNTGSYWCVNGQCLQAATPPTDANVQGPFATAQLCAAACGGTGPCPPPPDEVACAPSLLIQAPQEAATLHGFERIRVRVSDPNEQTDPCHHNYPRPCNHESDGPALLLTLGDFALPATWKQVSGTPLNGQWETLIDTRDISNGSHQLRVSMRGVGCCRVTNTVNVSLQNTLQGNIFYRDTVSNGRSGFVIGDAMIGVETRALEENSSRRYWEQWGVRSGTTLDGPYKHDDWDKHQPVIPVLGAQWNAQGARFQRHNYSAHVTFRLPLAREVRFRRKWTPQFFLSAFDLQAQTVAKIRAIESGRHYAFTTNPARVWIYDGDTVKVYGDFSVTPTVDKDELGDDEEPGDFEYLDRSGSNIYAPDALDCAVYGGEATGDKVYVVAPPSPDFPRGEVFAFDPDTKEVALEYGIRRENRVPRFIEAIGNRVVCLYVHDPATPLPIASKRTRAYDLTFATPTLLWQLDATATYCTVDDDTLLVACGSKFYSTDGGAVPTLLHDFGEVVTAATKTFVGLGNGQVWKLTGAGWTQVHSRPGAIGGTANWSAGTNGEAQTQEAHGVIAGQGARLVGERKNGTWYDERELRIPRDLEGKSVQNISALDLFSATVPAPSGTGDAAQLPQRDERLLVGTADSGLLFVYQRSTLSENDGAISVSHEGTPRLFPFPRRE